MSCSSCSSFTTSCSKKCKCPRRCKRSKAAKKRAKNTHVAGLGCPTSSKNVFSCGGSCSSGCGCSD